MRPVPQTEPETPAKPIMVERNYTWRGIFKTARLVGLFGLGILLDRYFSAATAAAGLAAASAVAIGGYDFFLGWMRHKKLKFLAGIVSDDVAQVKS